MSVMSMPFHNSSFAQRSLMRLERKGCSQMSHIVFTAGRIFDGTGASSFPGEIVIDGDRVVEV